MGIIYAILLLVFTALNLLIYHKCFHIVYFDLGRGLLKEVVTSIFVAFIELGILLSIGGAVLDAAGSIIAFILRIVVYVVIIAAVGIAAMQIYKAIKEIVQKNPTQSKTTVNEKQAGNGKEHDEKEKSDAVLTEKLGQNIDDKTHKRICKKCGAEIIEGIFCPECGTKYEESDENVPESETSSITKEQVYDDVDNKLKTSSMSPEILKGIVQEANKKEDAV